MRTPAEQGRLLLRALHETVLVRYDANATDIDDVIATGEFNCLSSALLYVIAAHERRHLWQASRVRQAATIDNRDR